MPGEQSTVLTIESMNYNLEKISMSCPPKKMLSNFDWSYRNELI